MQKQDPEPKSQLGNLIQKYVHRCIHLVQQYNPAAPNQRLARLLPDHVGFATAVKTGIMDGSMLYGLDQLATVYLGSWKGLILCAVCHLLFLLIDPGLKCDKPLKLQLLRCAVIIISSRYFHSLGGINLCLAVSGFVDHILWRWNAYRQGLRSNGDSVNYMLRDSLVLSLFILIPTILPASGAIGRTDWPFPRYVTMELDWTVFAAPGVFPLAYELFVIVRTFHGYFDSLAKFHLPRLAHLATITIQKSYQMVSVRFRCPVLRLVLTKCSLTYKPIDKSKNQIRLLELDQRTTFGEIRCKLVTKSLDDAGPFEAISYRWSYSDPLVPMLADEKRILVSQSVYLLLRSLQTGSDSPQMLWIDSICINQEDKDEKSWQIPLMGKIYSSATKVIAWIGGSPASAGSLRYISELSAALDLNQTPKVLDSFESRSKFNRNWAATQSLLEHEWFSRVWVVQEVAFAKDLLLRHSSDEEIHWETLDRFVSGALQRSSSPFLFTETNAAKSRTGKDLKSNNIISIRMMSNIRRQFHNSPDSQTLGLSLAMLLTAYLDSTEEKDRIYGLLGLTSEETKNAVQVDYKKETRDVILTAARHSLLRETTGMLALNMSWTPATLEAREAFQRLNLPSWCPDWLTQGAERAPPCRGQRRAALHLIPNIRNIENHPEQLLFRGFDLDSVLAVSREIPVLHSGVLQSESSIQEFIEMGIELCQKAPWSMYRQSPRDLFWCTILADSGESPAADKIRQLNRTLDNFKNNRSIWSPWMLPYSLEAYDHYFEAGRVWDKIGRAMVGRRFGLTEGGQTAIVPQDTAVGDRICVFFGAETPCVIRPKVGTIIELDKPNMLVGPCYVHGIMDGELAKDRHLAAQDLLIE